MLYSENSTISHCIGLKKRVENARWDERFAKGFGFLGYPLIIRPQQFELMKGKQRQVSF
jgi:hypothetical protein